MIGGTLFLLPLMTLPQAYGFDPGARPAGQHRSPGGCSGPRGIAPRGYGESSGTALPPPRAVAVDSGPEDPGGDNWHHNLIRERPVEVRLRTARKEIQTGHLPEVIGLLQAVLDSDDDVFVRLESQPAPSGARHLADQLISSLPAQARDFRRCMEAMPGGC